MTHPERLGRRGVATTVGLLVGALAYLLSLLDYRLDLTRRANALGYASNFFDLQGRAFLDGHLYVPRGSLGIEGFIENGREYMYFPPFPALLRLPILFLTHEYDGRLTLVSMGLAFVVLAVMAARLVWLVRDLLVPDETVSRGEAVWMAGLLALVTGGTTATFIAALPWVYHEVYAWAIALALGSMYWMLRVWQRPTAASICWLGGFNAALILTRTTGGWAMCLTTVGLGLWLARQGRGVRPRAKRPWAVVAAGVLALAAGIAVNWAKFRHPFLFPLEDQVWTQVNDHRREALAAGDGTITGPGYFPTAFMAYFRLDGVRFVDYFPWITLPARPAPSYGGAFVDQSYRTGSVTALMPWLLATTILAVPVVFRPGARDAVKALRFPFVGSVLVTGGVMAYGYFAYRYTAEFVPALILGGTIGTVTLGAWLRRRGAVARRVAVTVLAACVAYSIAAQMLIGHAMAALTRGVDLADYVALQERISPGSQAKLVRHGDGLPPRSGTADELWIDGECDAVYLGTGDSYEPWALVERRSVQVEVDIQRRIAAARFPIIEVRTTTPSSVWLEYDGHGRARIDLVTALGTNHGYWFHLLTGRSVRVGIRDLPGYGFAVVSATPGGGIGYLRSAEWDDDWNSRLAEIAPLPRQVARGIAVKVREGLALPICTRLTTAAAEAR